VKFFHHQRKAGPGHGIASLVPTNSQRLSPKLADMVVGPLD
jgi:hypothetical protein